MENQKMDDQILVKITHVIDTESSNYKIGDVLHRICCNSLEDFLKQKGKENSKAKNKEKILNCLNEIIKIVENY